VLTQLGPLVRWLHNPVPSPGTGLPTVMLEPTAQFTYQVEIDLGWFRTGDGWQAGKFHRLLSAAM
jgi:hypothetical protein